MTDQQNNRGPRASTVAQPISSNKPIAYGKKNISDLGEAVYVVNNCGGSIDKLANRPQPQPGHALIIYEFPETDQFKVYNIPTGSLLADLPGVIAEEGIVYALGFSKAFKTQPHVEDYARKGQEVLQAAKEKQEALL